MKINGFVVLCLIGILIFFGAVGASDLEMISISELFWRCLVGLALFLIGCYGGYRFDYR